MRPVEMGRDVRLSMLRGVRSAIAYGAATIALTAMSVAALSVAGLAQEAVGPAADPAASPPVIGTAMLPRDLSPWGMYINADPVVKAVLIGLAFASLVTWTVWLAKTIEIMVAKRRVRAASASLAAARSTAEGVDRLAGKTGEVVRFLDAAVTELKLSDG